jgi:uncharacterized protein (DUF2252 family)
MSTAPPLATTYRTLAEGLARGKALRQRVPRALHAQWQPGSDRPDPVTMLESADAGRVAELIPIRHGRMLPSPLTFFRGSAAAMAFDLVRTPITGIRVQLCGDCHLLNFGGFGTPEGNFVFDLTDFDETLPGPWEWDVKRLAASISVAGRVLGVSRRKCEEATLACVRSYRKRMSVFATMHALDLWHARIDGWVLMDWLRRGPSPWGQKTRPRTAARLLPKITEVVDGQRRFRDQPPLVFHNPRGDRFDKEVCHFLARYRETLQDDRRALLSRYRVVDLALKVVGIGSVGRRCAILLMMAGGDDFLLLQ